MRETLRALAEMQDGMWLGLGPYHEQYRAGLAAVTEAQVGRRIWARDGTLWGTTPARSAAIARRLGWLDLPTTMRVDVPRLEALFTEVEAAGLRRAVLLGMGGSSLAAETMALVLGVSDDHLPLTVLDSTDPAQVARVAREAPVGQTLFLVSSKSGTTTEVDALYRYFSTLAEDGAADPSAASDASRARKQFVAITDAGTPLEKLARAEGFRGIYLNPSDVGGRYSALSLFGLVPAAMLGVDLDLLLERARAMSWACRSTAAPEENPGLILGVAMGELARHGRDKLTILTSPGLEAFGPWVEQLIAESTGKNGVGILPVEGEPPLDIAAYGADRQFVYLRLDDVDNTALDERADGLVAAGHPLIALRLRDRYDLGAEFYRWEFATAVVGQRLGIDPFDQPNVEAAKVRARQALERYAVDGALAEEEPLLREGDLALYASGDAATSPSGIAGRLATFLRDAGAHDYVAIMAYMERNDTHTARLQDLRRTIGARLGVATTVGFGPRFLHSTGQFHKGGPNTGLFLQITHRDAEDLPVPDAGYTFGVLKRAQALGDLAALRDADRRVLRVHLEGDGISGLEALTRQVEAALAPRPE